MRWNFWLEVLHFSSRGAVCQFCGLSDHMHPILVCCQVGYPEVMLRKMAEKQASSIIVLWELKLKPVGKMTIFSSIFLLHASSHCLSVHNGITLHFNRYSLFKVIEEPFFEVMISFINGGVTFIWIIIWIFSSNEPADFQVKFGERDICIYSKESTFIRPKTP